MYVEVVVSANGGWTHLYPNQIVGDHANINFARVILQKNYKLNKCPNEWRFRKLYRYFQLTIIYWKTRAELCRRYLPRALSPFSICLRTCLETKTVLMQVLDRRLFSKFKFNFLLTHQQSAPIKYWMFLFWKLPWLNEILYFMKCILILWNYCSIIEHTIFFWLFVTQASIFYFQMLRRVTCGTKVTPVQLSQNVLRQLQVTGCADLAAV